MATGYTHPVCDGEITEFPDFALMCARAMGATIMQRDESVDSLPRPPEVSEYATKAVTVAEAALVEAQGWTEAESVALAQEAFDARRRMIDEARAAAAEKVARCDRMRDFVRAWVPPTADHVGLKKFMMEQLTETIEYERVDVLDEVYKAAPLDGAEFQNDEVVRRRSALQMARQRLAEEEARTADRREWITSLYESVGRQLASR